MADNTNRLAGIAYIAVNGQSYMLAGELTYSPGTVERESLIGQDTVHGYAEKPRAPFISGSFRDAGSLTVADFNAMTNCTVTCELANGKTVVGRNMWTVEAQEVKTPEATFEVKFEGFSGSVTEQ
ncbi:phage tail tube protein [Paraburkholderia mimosarum]|uniref:phage tail tube protein n=1 Tax=Paraburkholderia mimosarum TaxID=312026 RepID=UPI00041D3650|nr:phage tail tube protein [Paraburkholderia mimosarum]